MIDGEPMYIDQAPSTEQPQEHDFSVVQGFQVVAAGDHAVRNTVLREEAWRDALRLEFEARAARLHQAVDAAIVLASDGIIRWLGDPVAKLALGPNLLTPRAVILADESLPSAAHEIVSARIELWVAAMTRRLLGPLYALQELQEGSEPVRDLATKIAQSLGILEREPIRAQIKALDQNARAALRKHGVRFGAYYIYVPSVLRPAARNLALQLWGLHTPNVDADALARVLSPLASSGRTSLPLDGGISRDGYRIAGFRPCGDRIVRVDIVERLSDTIRAALVQRSVVDTLGHSSLGTSGGFAVSGQMTSLTGCSGDQFASILRSMGYESVELKRSEFSSPTPAPGSSSNGALSGRAEGLEPEPPDAVVPVIVGEEAVGAASDSAPVKQDEPPPDSVEDEIGPPTSPEGQACTDETKQDADLAASATLATSETAVRDADGGTIVVWRPAQRPRSGRGRHFRQTRSGSPKSERSKDATGERQDRTHLTHVSDRERGRMNGRQGELSSTDLAPGASGATARGRPEGDRPEIAPSDKKRRQPRDNRDRSRTNRTLEQQETKVDPNSPFAKLLELRQLLEGQSKKRT